MSEFENPNNLADVLLERAKKAEAELESVQKMFQWLAKSRDDWKRIACDNEARADKAEAELESVQKMCDHWEAKAAELQQRANKWQEAHLNRETLVWNANAALNAASVGIHHPADACGERKLMTLAERVQWLAKDQDDWKRVAHDNEARAVKAEEERDDLQRKLSKSEASVKALHDAVDYLEGKSKLQESRLEQAWDKLRRQKDIANPVDWERVRIEAAIAAMHGVLANPNDTSGPEVMVYFADALVAELQKKEVQG